MAAVDAPRRSCLCSARVRQGFATTVNSEQIPLPLNGLSSALDRLEQAVARLETAAGGLVPAEAIRKLHAVEAEAANLRDLHEQADARLAATIARLRAIVGDDRDE